MKTGRYIFSSESVTEGHPDKMADQISDAVLDAILTDDENGRVACETLLTTGLCVVSGEITTDTYVDIPSLARRVIHDIGYTRAKYGFDADTCGVITAIQHQSPDIAQGVDTGGAGDQGMMFGFACNETPELMPLPISLAHKLTRKLSEVRRDGVIPFLRPDGKSQVSIKYDGYKPVGISTVLISSQHDPAIPYDTIKEEIIERVIKPTLPRDLSTEGIEYLVNPTGKFAIGGPQGDTGLTGRKIIVDTYGGSAPHGGGAFSGKDPTKVDRSGAYMAIGLGKELVAAGYAERVQLQVAYAIALPKPVSRKSRHTKPCNHARNRKSKTGAPRVRPSSPPKIIQALNLRRPIYRQTAAYGHFGRAEFPWEETDMVDTLKKEAGIA